MDVSGGPIVVGLDGSPGSLGALEHALDEADAHGAAVRVVSAVHLPEYWALAYGMHAPPPPPSAEVIAAVRAEVQRAVDHLQATRGRAVPVAVVIREGPAGSVLVSESLGARLLVVGHRGRGAVASALLGSVGLHCVLHAACPVTVVRAVPVAEPEPAALAAPVAMPNADEPAVSTT